MRSLACKKKEQFFAAFSLAWSVIVTVLAPPHRCEASLQTIPPVFGTFYLRSYQGADGQFRNPPLPFDPYDGCLPIVELGEGTRIYLIEDTLEDQLLMKIRRAVGLRYSDTFAGVSDLELALNTLEGQTLETPGEILMPLYLSGEGLCLLPPAFSAGGSMIVGMTNSLDPNWALESYDLFYTTNLANLPLPELSATNWAWMDRSAANQTIFTLAIPSADQFWLRLGTMQDSDQDGLTDAYEQLASHTDLMDPYSGKDTNGNGVPDWLELAMGFNPAIPNQLGSSQGGYKVFIAQPAASSTLL